MSSGLLEGLSDDERDLLEPREHPDWMEPMLATLTDDRFSDEDWIFERKVDGERCLAFKDGTRLRLLSRNRNELASTYPEIADALEAQGADAFVVDGEIVAFDGSLTSFSKLQPRMQIQDEEEARASGVDVFFYVFDLLWLDGRDVTGLPLRRRKTLLRKLLDFRDPLRFMRHRNAEGEALYREACDKGWEGLIAKDACAGYVHGRSRKWLKFKCVHQQELVVVGWTDPGGSREGLGALLLGYYDGDRLRYAGKVGTGFDEETLKRLSKKLRSLERETPPVDEPQDELPGSGVHWARPTLVAEVGFTEWTDDGKLRHPRYLGLRDDKAAREVVRERAS